MSEQQLKAFLDTVKGNSDLQEKLKTATSAEIVISIAKEAGFMFSAEELKKVSGFEVLSDDELEGVAGGKYCSKTICVSLFSCA
ncbi:Nif11-like leader peptide family natural product precursor [Synechococcus sp. UW105]|uniref:Nif11-like leader peptide family natural product precursor n=1 Tax=Synechococcus sp. UW105 TaxID=337067 RepID=UPI000E0E8975|nr:Nif11-like leader peptide family natural product precursor [Synechococcus sp. UW105]